MVSNMQDPVTKNKLAINVTLLVWIARLLWGQSQVQLWPLGSPVGVRWRLQLRILALGVEERRLKSTLHHSEEKARPYPFLLISRMHGKNS